MAIAAKDLNEIAGFDLWGVRGPQTVGVIPKGAGVKLVTFTPEGGETPVSEKMLELIHHTLCFDALGATLVRDAGEIICFGCWSKHCQLEAILTDAEKKREARKKLAAFYSRLGRSVVTSN